MPKTNTKTINARPWKRETPPQKILAIRLQAMGDVVITLPYLQSLRNRFPHALIDFLTREEVSDIPRHLDLFDRVFIIKGGRNFKKQVLHALRLFPELRAQRYDVVLDLQRNPLSRWIRKGLNPSCWSEFDRFSPLHAGERTRLTIEASGLGSIQLAPPILKNEPLETEILRANGWQPDCEMVVLNPAGYFPSRNWPLENYAAFARLWLQQRNPQTQFLVLGVPAIKEKGQFLQAQLRNHLLNLTGKTTPAEAFAILRKVRLMLTEDSGLMHMAWVSGIPTLALFGSSRSDWSAPAGRKSLCLNSADLVCGECMEAECRFGDVRCLTRYTPEVVFRKALELLENLDKTGEVT
jgi:ADP-heptose:LPS heptosyltransferase